MDARRLPSLDPVAGFPVDAVERVRVIRVDEERGRAWVVGDLRYAVVDLVNPARTYTFSMPVTVCRRCAPTIWSMVLSPAHDRAFFQNRRQSLFAVRLSDLELAPEGPTRLNHIDFMNDIQLNPRTGELVVLLWGNIRSGMILVSSATLERSGTLPPVGDKALHMVVMP